MPGVMPSKEWPKSGCRCPSSPIEAIQAAEFASTGKWSIGVFQGLSSGNGREPCQEALIPNSGDGRRASVAVACAGRRDAPVASWGPSALVTGAHDVVMAARPNSNQAPHECHLQN